MLFNTTEKFLSIHLRLERRHNSCMGSSRCCSSVPSEAFMPRFYYSSCFRRPINSWNLRTESWEKRSIIYIYGIIYSMNLIPLLSISKRLKHILVIFKTIDINLFHVEPFKFGSLWLKPALYILYFSYYV